MRNLEHRGDLVYGGNGWSLLSRVQDFQTVDSTIAPSDRPYARLPQLLLTVAPWRSDLGLEVGADAEYDFFEHSEKVDGRRDALAPWVSWPVRPPLWPPDPKRQVTHSGLCPPEHGRGGAERPLLPDPESLDLDGKLIFERETNFLVRGAVLRDPGAAPVLCAHELRGSERHAAVRYHRARRSTSRASFAPTASPGYDRVGDENRLTLGLTSRSLNEGDGRELFRASMGQIFYFADHQVQLLGAADDSRTSSVAGELAASFLGQWSGRVSFQWDPQRRYQPRDAASY